MTNEQWGVLAQGSPEDVRASLRELIGSVEDTSRIVPSCGGGMPPGVPTENIEAFLEAASG
jgi:uroporphyrinogen-III decarboxylase